MAAPAGGVRAHAGGGGDEVAAQWTSEFPDRVVYVLDLRLPPRDRIPILEAAAAAARQIGDRRGEGNRLGNLGSAYYTLGEVRRAIEYCEQALSVAREIGDRGGEGNDLGNLGKAYADLGEVRRAIEYYGQALTVTREIGDRRGEADHCWNLGLLYEDSDPARAAELMQVRVEYEREIGHPDAEADAERVQGLLNKLGKGK